MNYEKTEKVKKVYRCPRCKSNLVQAGYNKVSPDGYGVVILELFAGCTECGHMVRNIQQVR